METHVSNKISGTFTFGSNTISWHHGRGNKLDKLPQQANLLKDCTWHFELTLKHESLKNCFWLKYPCAWEFDTWRLCLSCASRDTWGTLGVWVHTDCSHTANPSCAAFVPTREHCWEGPGCSDSRMLWWPCAVNMVIAKTTNRSGELFCCAMWWANKGVANTGTVTHISLAPHWHLRCSHAVLWLLSPWRSKPTKNAWLSKHSLKPIKGLLGKPLLWTVETAFLDNSFMFPLRGF